MRTEKHIVNKTYGNHQLARYIDVYEVSANGCHSVPESGYKGTQATLVDEPAWNEKFSSYSITGATLTGNNFILNNDVTAQANYETAKNVDTINCIASPNSGFIGDTASLSDTPAWNEKFSSYSITGSTLTGNKFRFTGSDITAEANYETAKNVTLQTDGHGTIAANRNSGFIGDQVTLSNTANSGYEFSNYSITGATLTGNKFNFIGNNVIAKAWFIDKYNPLGLPANTIRCKFVKGYTPTMGNSRTLVDSTNNVWDIYKASNDWSRLFGEGDFGPNYLLEVLGANTSNVTIMFAMFENCASLTSVALFDTSKVTNMIGMFSMCVALTSIPLFDTSNALNMSDMFYACYAVQSGALALYRQASTQVNIPTHSWTFRNCGINTTQGAAELAQIPSDWK